MDVWVRVSSKMQSGFRVDTMSDQKSRDVVVELHQSGRLAGFTRIRCPLPGAVEKRTVELITEVVQANGKNREIGTHRSA